jgi:predicted glycoside hydrolase/deacetylase ChbG (UPF0249 family)
MKYLVVNSDDFGMCHDVNTGTIKAFKEGIITQATIMVNCAWFEEGVALAKKHNMPCGVHLVSACEWDNYRWRPLTHGKSLVDKDGYFYSSRETLKKHMDPKEMEEEYSAQIELAMARGLKPSHIDTHMFIADEDLVAKICRKYKLNSRSPLGDKNKDCRFLFDTYHIISSKPAKEKREWLINHLKNLTDGYHFICVHASDAGPEIRSVCTENYPANVWAEQYRISDLEILIDKNIVSLSKELDIKLISVNEMKPGGHSK